MIQVSQLKKQYKEAVVLDIPELLISKGECFGLVGNNGAGKTTLFRILLDLVRASAGQVCTRWARSPTLLSSMRIICRLRVITTGTLDMFDWNSCDRVRGG